MNYELLEYFFCFASCDGFETDVDEGCYVVGSRIVFLKAEEVLFCHEVVALCDVDVGKKYEAAG